MSWYRWSNITRNEPSASTSSGDAAFASPEIYDYLEAEAMLYAIRLPANKWIKEGKNAIRWTRLSCRRFDHNAVRLQLHALAYNLGNFMRTLALPDAVEQWSLTSLRKKLIKIGAKIVHHGRYVTFQMAEVVIPRDLFADILRRIDRLRPPPAPA